jgi:hypothetical protein
VAKDKEIGMLIVKNWERFQHYKDRNPPWIKLHYEIMTSQDWVMLADASKLLAIVCMMIASRNEGRVPNNPHYVKRVAYLDKLPDFKPLIDCGFLEISLADASGCKHMLADARPETETYRTDTDTDTDIIIKKNNIKKPDDISESVWNDFLELRKTKKAKLTETALKGIIKQAELAGWTLEQALSECCERGWASFKAEWLTRSRKGKHDGFDDRKYSDTL